jgi:phosphoadenosine phosphosulfate reductase
MSVEVSLAPPRRPEAELRETLAAAARHFGEQADPVALLQWFGQRLATDRMAVAVSFSDGIMACLAARALPGVDLLFADTGYHFAETLGFRDYVVGEYPVNVRSLRPDLSVAEQDREYGRDLWQRDPDLCCAMRKTAPMEAALRGYDAWVTGLRRSDHAGRARTPQFGWDQRHGMIKINPIAAFSEEDVDACIEQYGIMENPLRQIGYRSIGCAPCTRPVADGEQERAGRWNGRAKVECGLHL